MALLCLPAAPAPCQTLVQSLSLGEKEMIGGAVTANQQTVLFLAAAGSSQVRAISLRPDGQTAWETPLLQLQHLKAGRYWFESAQTQRNAQARLNDLLPVQVFTSGDNVYTLEHLDSDGPKDSPFRAGQRIVQRIGTGGKTTLAVLEPVKYETSAFRAQIGSFPEDEQWFDVIEERDREVHARTTTYFLRRFDLTFGGAPTSVPLALPAPPERPDSNAPYNDWIYLGHRPGQTYFARRLASHSKKEKPFSVPMEYELLMLDNNGQKIGGVTTTLGLPANQFVMCSGMMPALLEQGHRAEEFPNNPVDNFEATTGAFGDFYLDYATGHCLIFGEYAPHNRPFTYLDEQVAAGFFVREYDLATGQLLRQADTPYPATVLNTKDKGQTRPFEGSAFPIGRNCFFSLDPLSRQGQFSFVRYRGISGRFSNLDLRQFNFGADWTYQNHLARHYDKPEEFNNPTDASQVYFVAPVMPFNTLRRDAVETRWVFGDGTADGPLYAAIRRLDQAHAPAPNRGTFYVAAQPNKSALILEQPSARGGQLNVYTYR